MRLIDADAFFGKLEKLAELMRQGKIGEIDLNLLIASMPIVDAVPVVRCKDCEHFYHSVSSDRDGRCVQFGTYDTDPSVYLNDFCSYGERRTNEG